MTMQSLTSTDQPGSFPNNATDRVARTRSSVLWAAYGDALGYISEAAWHEEGLLQKTGGAKLDRLMKWGRWMGPPKQRFYAELPAGCWSDDTQLRCAVSRSITNDGFGVDTFARVELPVWYSYMLGGGRASKAAALNLKTRSTPWYANTFSGWYNAGGNGAPMRIQPHVWASPDLKESFLSDVIIDSICTHSHPRAIVGACFHALALAHCLRTASPPTLNECSQMATRLRDAYSLIEDHESLSSVWLDLWQMAANENLQDRWQATVSELLSAIDKAQVAIDCSVRTADVYSSVCDHLWFGVKSQFGSGILTPVAAAALAITASDPYEGIVVAANELGTDTDTIATMAGALLGACYSSNLPPEDPLDAGYLLSEADRLAAISQGIETDSHQYPDLFTWLVPKTQADALVSDDGQLTVEGLGPVRALARELSWSTREDFAWQWVQTEFGQTLIIKRRPEIPARKV